MFELTSGNKMTENTQELIQLITLSQLMLGKAREELWEDVVTLEVQRRELLKLFFSEAIQQEYSESVAAGIELILSIDSDLTELGALKRFDIAQALKAMDQDKTAINAYTLLM
jgi:Flagellar protein FliT